jgi:high-affinity K+ transport system ATPase subunit B
MARFDRATCPPEGQMLKRIPVFQQEAVCLTKFGPESGETADEILARKDLERRSGTRAHKNEFWWGIGEKGAAQSINRLISQHGANVVLFCAIKSQKLPENGAASDILVWRRYSVLGGSVLHDIPKHGLFPELHSNTRNGTRSSLRTAGYFGLGCSL